MSEDYQRIGIEVSEDKVSCVKRSYCPAIIANAILYGKLLDTNVCTGQRHKDCRIASCNGSEWDILREGGFLFNSENLTLEELNALVEQRLKEINQE